MQARSSTSLARLTGARSCSSICRSVSTIPLGHKTQRVVDIRDEDADAPPVLVVEEA